MSRSSSILEEDMWTTALAEAAQVDVRNLGVSGFGPQQAAGALDRFVSEGESKIVLCGYFEGNDFTEASR